MVPITRMEVSLQVHIGWLPHPFVNIVKKMLDKTRVKESYGNKLFYTAF